ncbi:hypothetical protein [Christiangramia fulva]|nr:hypothetical protein [Christiangramia fulva]
MKFRFRFLILSLLIFCSAQAQTFNSSLTEYRYGSYELDSPYKWKNTSITITDDTITVITHQKNGMEAQRWAVNNQEIVKKENSTVHQYFTQLINAPKNKLLPTIFSVWKNNNGKIEFIDMEIPPLSKREEAPHITARFHIDYTF